MRRNEFDNRPELIENEGLQVRISFSVKEEQRDVQPTHEGDEPEIRTIYTAYVVRVSEPLSVESVMDAIIAEGFDILEAEAVACEAMLSYTGGTDLALAKRMMVARIGVYDKSDAVNEFFLNGDSMWLDDATRTKLEKRFDTDRKDGKQVTKLIYNGKFYELPIDTAELLLHQIESYARDCFDKTNEHMAAIAAKRSVNAVLSYDYTTGYPEKINLTLNE